MTAQATADGLVLAPVLDLLAAEPLCAELRQHPPSSPFILDGSKVERVSTPCLQVLAAAAATARGRGMPFLLQHASAGLREAIADLGLSLAIPLEE